MTSSVCPLLVLLLLFSKWGTDLENSVRDWVAVSGKRAPADHRLVFLGIDAESQSLDAVEPAELDASPALQLMKDGFPWSRKVYGLILDRLMAAGARTVVFDMLFPTARDGDDSFQGGPGSVSGRSGDRVHLPRRGNRRVE